MHERGTLMGKIRLLVVGGGGYGRQVAEAAELSGMFEVAGFLVDSLPTDETVIGYPVLGQVSSADTHRHVCDQAIVAIGNNSLRATLIQQLVAVHIKMPQSFTPGHSFHRARKLQLGQRSWPAQWWALKLA